MSTKDKNIKQSGFAIVEAIFAIVIIVVIVGGGVYLFQRKTDTKTSQGASQY